MQEDYTQLPYHTNNRGKWCWSSTLHTLRYASDNCVRLIESLLSGHTLRYASGNRVRLIESSLSGNRSSFCRWCSVVIMMTSELLLSIWERSISISLDRSTSWYPFSDLFPLLPLAFRTVWRSLLGWNRGLSAGMFAHTIALLTSIIDHKLTCRSQGQTSGNNTYLEHSVCVTYQDGIVEWICRQGECVYRL